MNTNESVFQFLKDAVLELKDIEEDDVTPESALETIDLESLDYVDLQVSIRKKYQLEIPSDLFVSGQISTLGQLASYIVEESAKLSAAAA
ncbi:MAG: phosphopantetheine-binding protein [Gammaproteobacteria bacterium]